MFYITLLLATAVLHYLGAALWLSVTLLVIAAVLFVIDILVHLLGGAAMQYQKHVNVMDAEFTHNHNPTL
jgi:hypothetical protein